MRKFKNNLRAELVDSYKKGWQRSILRYEEQYPSYILMIHRGCHPPTDDRPTIHRVSIKV